MFLCVSPNPAVDKRVRMGSLRRGQVNRAESAKGYAGGKAAHVAMVLHTLGEDTRWTGLCGGASGAEIVAGLMKLGIAASGGFTEKPARTNLEIVEEDGTVTEVLEPGETPGAEELAVFESACVREFSRHGENLIVVFSGSLPGNTKPDLYARLIAMAKQFKCKTFLDASGAALREGLKAKPFFLKPNREEASALFDQPVTSLSTGVSALRRLLQAGAESAALSLGKDGLLYCAGPEEPVLLALGLTVEARSTVGCGDSALAGFASGIASKRTACETLQLATACAAANCIADSPGAARIEDIRRFRQQALVQTLEDIP